MDEWQTNHAKNAHTLLDKFVRMPGTQENGVIDALQLRGWIADVRALAMKCDREEIVDNQIGKLTGSHSVSRHSPIVLEVLEEIGTESVLRGYELAVINGRGTTCRDPYDGGNQERELATQFQAYSEEYRVRFPRVSALWERLSNYYKRLAVREDEDAERMKLGR